MMTLGTAPKHLPEHLRQELQLVRPPAWIDQSESKGEQFRPNFECEDELMTNGRIGKGALIRANNMAFKPGAEDYPGNILYSFDPNADSKLLREASSRAYSLGNDPNLAETSEEKEIADIFQSETIVVHGKAVSKEFAKLDHCVITLCLFDRRHLPYGLLRLSVFPVLASPNTKAAIVLPFFLWSEEARTQYEMGGDDFFPEM